MLFYYHSVTTRKDRFHINGYSKSSLGSGTQDGTGVLVHWCNNSERTHKNRLVFILLSKSSRKIRSEWVRNRSFWARQDLLLAFLVHTLFCAGVQSVKGSKRRSGIDVVPDIFCQTKPPATTAIITTPPKLLLLMLLVQHHQNG